MTSTYEAPQLDNGYLLLADISGYTTFLGLVTAAHPDMIGAGGEVPPAYPVLSSLLDVVVERIAPAFLLSELEGDAVFGYAPDDRPSGDVRTLLEVVRSAYGAFRSRLEEAMVLQKHDCEACMVLHTLELKFVLHHGSFVIQRIAGRMRLLSPAVNVTHRLIKNSVTERTGHRGYLFVTSPAAERLKLPPEVGIGHQEQYADVGLVTGIVVGLDSTGAPAAGPV
ncbi:MAG: DUF2652 domain-containing protein [Actinomycetota bacterium]